MRLAKPELKWSLLAGTRHLHSLNARCPPDNQNMNKSCTHIEVLVFSQLNSSPGWGSARSSVVSS
jgi:hypothetical protein